MTDPESALWPNLAFDLDGATVVPAATAALTRLGLYVVRSFDLRSALATHADCVCPQHGTAQCTCQFAVLLVYGDAPQPVTLTIHCRNGQTQMQIIHDPAAPPDPDLAEQIMRGLTEVALSLPNPPIQAPGLAAHLR